jgi:hypothetical protein
MLVQLGLFFAYYQEVGSPVKVNVKERLRLIQRMKRVVREGIGEPLPKKKELFWRLKNKKEGQEQYLRKENPCPSPYKKLLGNPTLRVSHISGTGYPLSLKLTLGR